jgi:hypothetical protein
MNYKWKILEISATEGLITHAKYKVVGTEDGVSVETEGNWWFKGSIIKIPFDQVSEQMVCNWIKKETTENNTNLIESRLQEQLDSIKSHVPAVAPWRSQIFTLGDKV